LAQEAANNLIKGQASQAAPAWCCKATCPIKRAKTWKWVMQMITSVKQTCTLLPYYMLLMGW